MVLVMCVAIWASIGAFTAWIGTRLERRGSPAGVGNAGIAVLGALVGGFGVLAAFRGADTYNIVLLSAVAAQLVAAGFLALADVREGRHAARREVH